MITGYASKATKLPKLLAAYKKYGSRAETCCVRLNQCCSNGPLVETVKKGNPTTTSMVRSSHQNGSDCQGADCMVRSESPMGNAIIVSRSNDKCTRPCARTEQRL